MDLEAPTPRHTATARAGREPHEVLTDTVFARHFKSGTVASQFRLARTSGPDQTVYDGPVREWASTKARTTAAAAGKPRPDNRDNSGVYQTLLDPYEIRVLELLPGAGGEPLRCRLLHCSVEFTYPPEIYLKNEVETMWLTRPTRHALSIQDLTKPVWYTALSYTWGPNVFEASIECDGHTLTITRSLETALRHFRQLDGSVFMWIDQICINQADNEEKAQQIPLMSRIYQRAYNTVIWLGPATDGSDSAMRLLDDIDHRLRFGDSDLGPADFKSVGLPPPDSEVWHELWHLLSRQWFTRTWVVQEVILSLIPWVACGHSHLPWASVVDACLNLSTRGVSRWLQQRFGHSSTGSPSSDVFASAVETDVMKRMYETRNPQPGLLDLLVNIRAAQCYDPRDKVYALLGICPEEDSARVRVSYAKECTAASQYHAVMTHLLEDGSHWKLLLILTSVDHEFSPDSDLPSWVPDWSKPRQTTALGYMNIKSGVYNAAGWFNTDDDAPPEAVYRLSGANNEEIRLQGLVEDTLVQVSDVFTDPELSYVNPTVENKTLLAAVDFFSQVAKQMPGTDIFDPFWRTLVAGKDDSDRAKAPASFAEVFSLLLDESSGRSPTLPGQTYSPRQLRPKGRGRLELSNLGARTVGRTFQAARVAMKKALQNRRLGVTEKGRLGLFPRHSEVGDSVCVLASGHVPFLLRAAEESRDGRFRLVGECFVHGIMEGEAVARGLACMGDITLV